MEKTIVLALGGNAISSGNDLSYEGQLKNIEKTASLLAKLVEKGHKIVLSHGNGPQVGGLLLQNEMGRSEVPEMPLELLTSQTQGYIGYLLEQALFNEFNRLGIKRDLVTILTRVKVDREDEAFLRPTKPIGKFYSEDEKDELIGERGYNLVKDSNRGYRRVVYSPRPESILEKDTIRELLDSGKLVIAAGGGGIPVVEEDGVYRGVEAVIDKDLTSAKLAEELDADVLMILTDVDYVYLNYASDDEIKLEDVTVGELEAYIEEGHFSEGSMLPKVQGAMQFARNGKEAYISSLSKLAETLDRKAGTKIVL